MKHTAIRKLVPQISCQVSPITVAFRAGLEDCFCEFWILPVARRQVSASDRNLADAFKSNVVAILVKNQHCNVLGCIAGRGKIAGTFRRLIEETFQDNTSFTAAHSEMKN